MHETNLTIKKSTTKNGVREQKEKGMKQGETWELRACERERERGEQKMENRNNYRWMKEPNRNAWVWKIRRDTQRKFEEYEERVRWCILLCQSLLAGTKKVWNSDFCFIIFVFRFLKFSLLVLTFQGKKVMDRDVLIKFRIEPSFCFQRCFVLE